MYEIFVTDPKSTSFFAAEELKKYLRMLMPRCGEIDVKYDPKAEKGFRLGFMQDFGLDVSDVPDPALDDIVYYDTDSEGGVIAGSNPIALLIAVYRWLRAQGCRWLFPGVDGEYIPVIDGLSPVKYRKKADHRHRGQCNEGAEFQQDMLETIDFTPKIGLNTYMLEFDIPHYYYDQYYSHINNPVRPPEPVDNRTVLQWKRQCESEIRKRGLHFHDMGHGWTAESFGIDSTRGWVKSEGDAVPPESRKYLAEINGERKLFGGIALNTNICLSNPEAREKMADYIASYAEAHTNVGWLHVWMADASNNNCECAECKKKIPTDWYLTLMNEIDEKLTAKGLSTRIVFLAYLDLFWPPQTVKIKNPDRFTMLYAPITRLYTESYSKDADESAIVPFNLNKNVFPNGMSQCLGYLKRWKESWKGDCFSYEYHFMTQQFYDLSGLFLPRLIHEDVTSLKKHGINGIVEDGSQRSYFPNGLAFSTYGETLFDSSMDFEEFRDDYFAHAYGADWKKVLNYMTKLEELVSFKNVYDVFRLRKEALDECLDQLRADHFGSKLMDADKLVKEFVPVIEKNLSQEYRASAVAWRLLKDHAVFVRGIIRVLDLRLAGAEVAADEAVEALKRTLGEREIYIERWYDQRMCFVAYRVRR